MPIFRPTLVPSLMMASLAFAGCQHADDAPAVVQDGGTATGAYLSVVRADPAFAALDGALAALGCVTNDATAITEQGVPDGLTESVGIVAVEATCAGGEGAYLMAVLDGATSRVERSFALHGTAPTTTDDIVGADVITWTAGGAVTEAYRDHFARMLAEAGIDSGAADAAGALIGAQRAAITESCSDMDFIFEQILRGPVASRGGECRADDCQDCIDAATTFDNRTSAVAVIGGGGGILTGLGAAAGLAACAILEPCGLALILAMGAVGVTAMGLTSVGVLSMILNRPFETTAGRQSFCYTHGEYCWEPCGGPDDCSGDLDCIVDGAGLTRCL